jgi:hypothetical protein
MNRPAVPTGRHASRKKTVMMSALTARTSTAPENAG